MIEISWALFVGLVVLAAFSPAAIVAAVAYAEHGAQRIADRILDREFGPRPTAWVGDLLTRGRK